jgi:hypothetical protein
MRIPQQREKGCDHSHNTNTVLMATSKHKL